MYQKIHKIIMLSLVLLFLTGISTVFAAANFQFHATEVCYLNPQRDDILVVKGVISNDGDSTGRMYGVGMKVKCWDNQGRLCVNDNAYFDTNITLNSGETVGWEFTIHHSNNTRYHGPWKWDVDSHQKWENY